MLNYYGRPWQLYVERVLIVRSSADVDWFVGMHPVLRAILR